MPLCGLRTSARASRAATAVLGLLLRAELPLWGRLLLSSRLQLLNAEAGIGAYVSDAGHSCYARRGRPTEPIQEPQMKQRTKQHGLCIGAAAASWLLAAPAAMAASTSSGLEPNADTAEHEAAGNNVLSLKLAGLEIVAPAAEGMGPIGAEEPESEGNRVLRRVGVSIGIERALVPGWLDAEVSVLLAPGPGGLTLPIDFVLKKPFELSHRLEGFIGLGLATEWLEAGHAETAYGVASQLGAYYWVAPHWALAFEGEYNLLLSPETAHEFVLASGGAFRF